MQALQLKPKSEGLRAGGASSLRLKSAESKGRSRRSPLRQRVDSPFLRPFVLCRTSRDEDDSRLHR